MIPFPGSGSSGGEEVEPTSEPQAQDSIYSSGSGTGELPRSASADEAAQERGYDDQIWSGENESSMDEGELMQDPWSTGEDEPGWGDFFGGDGDE